MKCLDIRNKSIIFVSRNKNNDDMKKTILHKADLDTVLHTTYFEHTLITTVNKIAEAVGEPHSGESGDGKTSVEWRFVTDSGLAFTIYDWKEYDKTASENRDEKYAFHIGVNNGYEGGFVLAILKSYGL